MLSTNSDANFDPRVDVQTVYTEWTGIIITTTSSLMSTICSGLILFLIFRSRMGLKSVYHRIIFGLSLCDIIKTLPMMVTTLPLPVDTIYGPRDGIIAGNDITCTIQGFLYTFGSLASGLYNAFLCI